MCAKRTTNDNFSYDSSGFVNGKYVEFQETVIKENPVAGRHLLWKMRIGHRHTFCRPWNSLGSQDEMSPDLKFDRMAISGITSADFWSLQISNNRNGFMQTLAHLTEPGNGLCMLCIG